jgi:hypothetical protein
MNTLETALDIIHECGSRRVDWDKWAETDLHNFMVRLCYIYSPWSMLQAMISYYEENLEVTTELLKEEYDPVTGLDAYGDGNKGDLRNKQQCEESLEILRDYQEIYNRHADELNLP